MKYESPPDEAYTSLNTQLTQTIFNLLIYISFFIDNVSNEEVRNSTRQAIGVFGPYKDSNWIAHGHINFMRNFCTTFMEGIT